MNSAISTSDSETPADTSSAAVSSNSSQTAPKAPAPVVVYMNPKKQVKPVIKLIKKTWKGKEIAYWEVRVGSSLAKVYATPTGNRVRYSVVYWLDGQRKRELFNSKEEALEAAKKTGSDLGKPDFGGAGITGTVRLACERALETAKPFGIPIDVMASKFAYYWERLPDVPLHRLVDDWLERHPPGMAEKKVREVANELVASKVSDKLSLRYQKQLGYDMDRFCARFHGQLTHVKGVDVDKWLRDLGVGPRTRNNLRNSVNALFKFAMARKYLPKGHDEMDAVAVAKDRGGEIEIYTPLEMAELLAVASPEHVPFLAISAFAGVRHAELQRLDWANVNRKAEIIEI